MRADKAAQFHHLGRDQTICPSVFFQARRRGWWPGVGHAGGAGCVRSRLARLVNAVQQNSVVPKIQAGDRGRVRSAPAIAAHVPCGKAYLVRGSCWFMAPWQQRPAVMGARASIGRCALRVLARRAGAQARRTCVAREGLGTLREKAETKLPGSRPIFRSGCWLAARLSVPMSWFRQRREPARRAATRSTGIRLSSPTAPKPRFHTGVIQT